MRKQRAKKLISHVLAAAMCMTSIPMTAWPVYAAEEQGEAETGLSVSSTADSDSDSPTQPGDDNNDPSGMDTPSIWEFTEDTQGWAAADSWNGAEASVSHDAANGRLEVGFNFSNCTDEQIGNWPAARISYQNQNGLDISQYNKMTMDVYCASDAQFDGMTLAANTGSEADLIGQEVSLTQNMAETDGGLKKATISFPIDGSKAETENPKELILAVKTGPERFRGEGKIWIDNIKFETVTVQKIGTLYDFADGLQGWNAASGWLSSNVGQNVSYDAAGKRLAMELDYRKADIASWPNSAVCVEAAGGFDFSGHNKLTFDFYYKPEDMTTGNLYLKAIAETDGNDAQKKIFVNQEKWVSDVPVEDAADGYKKASFSFQMNEANTETVHPTQFLIVVTGNSDFQGTAYIDNVCFTQEGEGVYVNSTVKRENQTELTTDAASLNINGTAYPYAASIKLVDADATADAKKAYQYLKAVGESDAVVYGHMEDTVLKAGAANLSKSDTEDIAGSISAIDGFDCGGLFDGYKDKYTSRYPEEPVTWEGSSVQQNIKAAALFANRSIEDGALVTLSSHMPNFAYAQRRENPDSAKTYDQFDYSKADSYQTDNGDCMRNLLPGQKYNEAYTAYLDLIAEYAKQVDGAVLFRPLHENTGGWFWWGNACTPETYKSVFKYTVEYLRDIKQVHNFIYLYGPGSEAANETEYEERYPGDGYVDLVGFDSYDAEPKTDEDGYTFQKNLQKTMEITSNFAKNHGKLFAVTETGISNPGGKGLLLQDNARKDWYCEILELAANREYNCCYFMLWSNYSSTSSYYTPFVAKINEDGTLYGHEMLDGFLRFCNDKRSIFAGDQKHVLASGITSPDAEAADGGMLDGYIISPSEGSRLTGSVRISARLTKETAEAVKFVLTGAEGQTLELNAIAETDDGQMYTAELTAEQLAAFTPEPDGTLDLYVGGRKLQQLRYIINIAEQTEDPLVVDDFESYLGRDTLMGEKWKVNKESSCTLAVSLADDIHSADGSYAMKFDFGLKKGGYVGTEIAKTADWSGCNALQLWVKPDGLNQKTVIQIKIGNDAYEAYLNTYEAYQTAQKPLLVTLPFDAFVHKENGSKLTAQAAAGLTGLGLWMNALDASFADADSTLSGVLYYDDIKAVTTDRAEPTFEEAPDSSDETQTPGDDETQEPGGDETQKPGGDETQKPGDETQTPGGSTQTPGGSTQTPGSSTPIPGGSTQTPGSSTQKPDDSTQKPDDGNTQTPDDSNTTVPEQVENKVVKANAENADGIFTDTDGQPIRNAIVESFDGKKYITDTNGRKRTAQFVDTTDGTTYYVKETGVVAEKEIIQVDHDKYFAKEAGPIAKGEFCTTAKGSTIYAKKDGKLAADQVITVNNKKYYMKSNCALAKRGFYTTSYGNRVYARKSGELVTSRVFVSKGRKYFAKSSGAVAVSCFCVTASGNKVYAAASGALAVNKIFTVNGARYYAKQSGAIAVKKWIRVGTKSYYCSASGKITKTQKAK